MLEYTVNENLDSHTNNKEFCTWPANPVSCIQSHKSVKSRILWALKDRDPTPQTQRSLKAQNACIGGVFTNNLRVYCYFTLHRDFSQPLISVIVFTIWWYWHPKVFECTHLSQGHSFTLRLHLLLWKSLICYSRWDFSAHFFFHYYA